VASASTVVKGMKKNGMHPPGPPCGEASQTDTLARQAVARQQGALPPSRKPDVVGEAH
jgi:hypothetical protein